MRRSRKQARGVGALVTSLMLFAVILAVVLANTAGLSQGATEEGMRATRQAVMRAAVLCYATEGFYPPSLNYIKEHYNVQIDRRYLVNYEVFSPGVYPSITVVPLNY